MAIIGRYLRLDNSIIMGFYYICWLIRIEKQYMYVRKL